MFFWEYKKKKRNFQLAKMHGRKRKKSNLTKLPIKGQKRFANFKTWQVCFVNTAQIPSSFMMASVCVFLLAHIFPICECDFTFSSKRWQRRTKSHFVTWCPQSGKPIRCMHMNNIWSWQNTLLIILNEFVLLTRHNGAAIFHQLFASYFTLQHKQKAQTFLWINRFCVGIVVWMVLETGVTQPPWLWESAWIVLPRTTILKQEN